MEVLLVYSNKCNNCVKLKTYSVFDKINKLNIDNKINIKNIPSYINSVPSLIITKKGNVNVLKNNDLLNWFKMNSNNNDPIYNMVIFGNAIMGNADAQELLYQNGEDVFFIEIE